MSIRIHRAMGWGMTWEDFSRLTTLKEPEGNTDKYWLSDVLYDAFEGATPAQLTVPREVMRSSFEEKGVSILEPHLLSKTFTENGRKNPTNVSGNNLFFTPGFDEHTHVGFFPNAYYGKKWSNFDNDLDYAFEQWRSSGERGQSSAPRDFVRFVGYGFYPWTNDLMLPDGSHTPWQVFHEVEEHPEWLPAVPKEIRWYLPKLGVLDDLGVNQLKPMIAQWWA